MGERLGVVVNAKIVIKPISIHAVDGDLFTIPSYEPQKVRLQEVPRMGFRPRGLQVEMRFMLVRVRSFWCGSQQPRIVLLNSVDRFHDRGGHAPERWVIFTREHTETLVYKRVTAHGRKRNEACTVTVMNTDKHFNEPGGLPEPLEDHEPNDMPATRGMFFAVMVVAFIAVAVLALLQVQW